MAIEWTGGHIDPEVKRYIGANLRDVGVVRYLKPRECTKSPEERV